MDKTDRTEVEALLQSLGAATADQPNFQAKLHDIRRLIVLAITEWTSAPSTPEVEEELNDFAIGFTDDI